MATPGSILVYCGVFVVWFVGVLGTGCQHPCDCGFKWSGDDSDEGKTAFRYEVMGGLLGAFGPLCIGGLGYLIYRKCCNPTPGKGSRLSTPWRRESSWGAERVSPRGTTPISLYGETDDNLLSDNNHNGSKPRNNNPNSNFPPSMFGGGSDIALTSRLTNVHKSVEGNEINQWFKNVTQKKY